MYSFAFKKFPCNLLTIKNRTFSKLWKDSLNRKLRYVRKKKLGRIKQGQFDRGHLRIPPLLPERIGISQVRGSMTYQYGSRKMLREYYGFINETSLKKIYKKIMSKKLYHRADRYIKLIDIIERRLDVFCFKVGYFNTLLEARHHIKRGSISVNSKVQTRWKYTIHDEDFISLNFNKSDFTYNIVCDRIKSRIDIYKNNMKQKINSIYDYRVSAHIPRAHFDFNYTTLSVMYRRSIRNTSEMIDCGSVFGKHNSLLRALQYYWFSYLCKD